MSDYAATDVPWWRARISPARRIAGMLMLLLAGLFFYAMFGKGMRFFQVESESMLPTLHAGDRLVAMPATEYHRGEIVIVRDPLERNGYLVKRIIAVAGDTIEVRHGAVFVNGAYVSEPYRPEPIAYPMGAYTVADGEVFVLGDNSNLSVDSHNWAGAYIGAGTVLPKSLPIKSVVARAFFQYYPINKMQRVGGYPIDAMLAAMLDLDLGPTRSAAAQTLQ